MVVPTRQRSKALPWVDKEHQMRSDKLACLIKSSSRLPQLAVDHEFSR